MTWFLSALRWFSSPSDECSEGLDASDDVCVEVNCPGSAWERSAWRDAYVDLDVPDDCDGVEDLAPNEDECHCVDAP